MQLTEAEVIAGLSHPEIHVRDALLNYFENRHTPPLELTHAMIEAVDKWGWEEAFQWPHKISECLHDNRSLVWCLDEIDKIQTGTSTSKSPNSTLPFHLVSWITQAPVQLFKSHRERLADTQAFLKPQLYDTLSPLEEIDRRIEIASLDSQQAWEQLTEHCHSVANVDKFEDGNVHYAKELLAPIVADGDNYRDRMMEILSDPVGDHQGAHGWMVGLMVYLAGRIKCEESLPLLLGKFAVEWDWYSEEILHAIQAMGTPSAHLAVAEYYHGKPWHVRNYLNGILENIHYQGAAETIFPLIEDEPDGDLRVQLATAMSAQLDDFAIEPASKVYREHPHDPERIAIIENLYALASVADIDLPEKEAWGKNIEALANRNNEIDMSDWISRVESAMAEDANQNADTIREGEMHLIPPPHHSLLPVVKKQGRNDPCACGSGKKYKKCCLRADSQLES